MGGGRGEPTALVQFRSAAVEKWRSLTSPYGFLESFIRPEFEPGAVPVALGMELIPPQKVNHYMCFIRAGVQGCPQDSQGCVRFKPDGVDSI